MQKNPKFFWGLGAILSAEFICGGGYWIGGTSSSSSSSSSSIVVAIIIIVVIVVVVVVGVSFPQEPRKNASRGPDPIKASDYKKKAGRTAHGRQMYAGSPT